MNCKHCVARDTKKKINEDLVISKQLINWINKSPFMVLVITGGEPLLHNKESDLLKLISNIRKKALIIDTNGTIFPSQEVVKTILEKDILLRISMDSINPNEEIKLRMMKGGANKNLKAYYTKLNNIRRFQPQGITIGIPSPCPEMIILIYLNAIISAN